MHAASPVNPESLYRDANRSKLLRAVIIQDIKVQNVIQDDDVRNAYAAVTFEEHIDGQVFDIAMNTILQCNDTGLDEAKFSLLRDWLISSGVSSHITPHAEDSILNVEESNAVVQVANGVLIRAELRGTVRIRLQDLNDPRITCDILVHGVLYVPGLSRRLLSVDQWNAAGGEIWFHPQHTTLCAVDSKSGEAHSFSVAKPFTLLRNMGGLPSASSQTQHHGVQEEAHVGIQSAATVAKKRPTSSDLLHRCLGHRAVNAMMTGSRNEVWADSTQGVYNPVACRVQLSFHPSILPSFLSFVVSFSIISG